MTSALDRIKASMAAAGQTPTPATPVQPEAPAAPAAANPAAPAAPAAAPAATAGELAITDQTEAAQALSVFFGPAANTVSVADLADAVDGDGGIRFTHPFATLKKGNWEIHKSCPTEVEDYMPVGNRPFRAIFLGYRIGLLGWAGGSTVGGGGQPPLWGAALPTPLVDKAAPELIRKALHLGNKIQYTKRHLRVKFDAVGRLTPELHMFLWTPGTGFFVAVAPGQATTRDTLESIKPLEAKINGLPVLISIHEGDRKNPKAENPEAREWVVYSAELAPAMDDKGVLLKQEFDAFQQRDAVGLANEILKFHRTLDYDGLRGQALVDKLNSYDGLI